VVGAKVLVTGLVQEAIRGKGEHQLTMTQIAATRVKVTATAQALPKPVVLGPLPANSATIEQWERYEGMRVSVPAMTVVGPVGGTIDEATGKVTLDGRFYGVARGTPRPFREPGVDPFDPSSLPAGVQRFDGNAEKLMIVSGAQSGAKRMAADAGDTVTGLVGVLAYGDGVYQLWPDPVGAKVIPGALQRPVAPTGAFTIGEFNVGRLFDDMPNPGVATPVLSEHAYAMRLAKTANAICAYARSPAILGVQQVENAKVLSDLARAINDHAGNALFPKACSDAPAYRPVGVGSAGPDGALGFLVSSAEVWPGKSRVEVHSNAVLAQTARFKQADGSSGPLFAASPVLLQARLNGKQGDGLDVTVLAVNLQPLEGIDADAKGTHGWHTQGEQVRAQRQAQALWLANWMQQRQAVNPTEKLVVLGGFNANEFDDGHADLMGLVTGKPGGKRVLDGTTSKVLPALSNLTWTVPAAERYDAVWQGNAEETNHILVNRALLDSRCRMRVDHARLNADFGLDNYDDFQVPLRTSAQDPMVLSVDKP